MPPSPVLGGHHSDATPPSPDFGAVHGLTRRRFLLSRSPTLALPRVIITVPTTAKAKILIATGSPFLQFPHRAGNPSPKPLYLRRSRSRKTSSLGSLGLPLGFSLPRSVAGGEELPQPADGDHDREGDR